MSEKSLLLPVAKILHSPEKLKTWLDKHEFNGRVVLDSSPDKALVLIKNDQIFKSEDPNEFVWYSFASAIGLLDYYLMKFEYTQIYGFYTINTPDPVYNSVAKRNMQMYKDLSPVL